MLRRNLIPLAVAGTLLAAGLGATVANADPPIKNFIVGTPGNDLLIGTKHRDFIFGRRGNDRIIGRKFDDVLLGGPGDDILRAATPLGHSGADILRGGLGDDRCIGDRSDTFRGCEVIVVRG